ncbi:MAG: MG2 domain-containing protein [Acidobacteria bacterium]|nr:MG2 domain-containing protein [Acidobacteriota bacterium]
MIPNSTDDKGLVFRLSEGREESKQGSRTPIATTAEPLSDEAAQNLLKRVPQIKSEVDDEKDFAMRDRSLPPPRTGQTISEAFPPSDRGTSPDQLSSGPLEILRFAPEGDVPIAPHLSVTFSQPMVAVTSNSDLAELDVPVKLSPQPKGKWRWIGTRTLLFEPEGRFPMSTKYAVEIPSGTRSATGGTLTAAKRWAFSTPPLQIKLSHPNAGPQPRNPLFFIEFDQRIDQNSLLKHIRLEAQNRESKLRLATAQEIAADDNARQLASRANIDCWIAFRAMGGEADKPLLTGTNYTVTLERGAPSAEGPLVTPSPKSFSFDTYGPLKLIRYECGHQNNCEPGWPWILQFNNSLDLKAFDKKQIRVEPEVPGMKVDNYGYHINLAGATRGRTTYTVTLDASIRDAFGQTLGENKTVTFNVGEASPALAASAEGLAVLDPFASPRFSIFSINHKQLKVSLYAVGPEHWGQFTDFTRNAMQDRYQRGRNRSSMPPIGRLVFSKVIDIAEKPDDLAETPVDVKPALNDGFGQMILSVEAVQPPKNEWERRSIQVWIQATNIGLDAFVDQTNLLGWATSLKDGKPQSDVQLTVVNEKTAVGAGANSDVKTGNDGLARISLPNSGGRKLLIARKGKDLAILPESLDWWGDQTVWQKRSSNDSLRWHVFDDRGMYKPGEEVHIKGWLRRIAWGPKGDLGLLNGAVSNVSYTLRDMRGNEVQKGTARVNALGGFDMAFKLPNTMNLGFAWLMLKAEGAGAVEVREFNHQLRVQEFRRPEYEVKATANQGPHFVGSHANVTVAANYYAGGGLPNADVHWHVMATPTNYTPPNRGDFIFGKWIPWWRFHQAYEGGKNQEFTGRTDVTGKHYLRIDFDSVNPPRPTNVVAYANVQDVNRQSLSGSVTLLVHPSELYVGIRSSRLFVQKGEPIVVDSIVTDLDGKAIANREIRMRAALVDWVYEKGEWREQETNAQDCVIKSGSDPVKCRFETKEGGRYRITARIIDDRERRNESEMTLWVAGGKQPPQRDLAQEKVELIPDRKEYQSGETAEILVQAPFAPAEGVMTLRRSGLVTSERFTMTGASHTLKIPINDDLVPNVHVQVDLAGASSRTDAEGKTDVKLPKRPAFASGTLNISVPPTKRKLTVTATPRDKITEPGAETFVDIEMRDAAGKPVSGGEVALVVVDEAVLALTNYQLSDPLKNFYAIRGDDVRNHHLRQRVQLARSEDLISQMRQGGGQQGQQGQQGTMGKIVAMDSADRAMPLPMSTPQQAGRNEYRENAAMNGRLMSLGGAGLIQPAETIIRARLDFNALVTFAAAVPTDANGRASVKVKLLDNLTRYRVMAVAVAGEKQFGSAESSITARLPLMVRPSAPRFLNFGDKIELPVVVQNQTDAPMQVDLAVRATNAQLTAGQGRRVTVPANDRVEVRFPAAAAKPGIARFQIVGASGKWADAAEVSLPVWTPATTEAFATYGEVDAGAIIQPVKAPSDAIRQFGGLEVTTSSTQLQALTDAVIYLTSYPFECTEQLASRVLAIAALRDVLAAFDAKGLPKPDELIASVKRDMEKLRGMQNEDGGFGFWRRGQSTWPYLGIHVAHTMQRAKEKSFDVPADMFQRSKLYIRNIEQHIPGWYGPEARRVLIAYSLYVRNRIDDRDVAKARRLIAEAGGVNKLPLEALGWLLPVLSGDPNSQAEVLAIRRHLGNRAEETAAAAHFTTSYADGAHLLLHSDRRADAIILEALIGDDPKNDLIPKIVRGLLGHRKQGRWENTQENAFVLLALDRYFATYEKVTPDFVARAWLGEAYAGGHEFRGRTTERHQINVPMSYLMSQGSAQNLILGKQGTGRLYYRIGMQYAPTSLQLKPADYGFTVTRVYEAVDNANDVRREEDGTWRIKAGAQVRVRLTMVAQARRYHVALVDPLPAGLEAMNPSLATTGPVPQDPKEQTSGNRWWWWRQWFEHQNMRDERVEAFTSLLWEGVYTYSYVARATTPGVFVVPPSKAEEMYHPETYGRGATDRVVVE